MLQYLNYIKLKLVHKYKGFDSLGQLFIDRQVAAIENANSNKYGTNTKQIQVALKENEDSNPEFKRVLAERAKRLERVKIRLLNT